MSLDNTIDKAVEEQIKEMLDGRRGELIKEIMALLPSDTDIKDRPELMNHAVFVIIQLSDYQFFAQDPDRAVSSISELNEYVATFDTFADLWEAIDGPEQAEEKPITAWAAMAALAYYLGKEYDMGTPKQCFSLLWNEQYEARNG